MDIDYEEIIPEEEKEIIREGFFFALISYISFLCIVSILLKRENKFSLFHAKQGLVLFILESALIIFRLLLGKFFGFFYFIGILFCVALSFWGIFSVLMGRYKSLPLLGEIAQKILL